MYKILILFMDFRPDPPRPFGGFKNPLENPAGPSGIFKIPSGLGGIWAKIPSTKSEFSIQINFGRTLAPGTPV